MPVAHKLPENSPIQSFFSQCDPKAEIYVSHIDTANVAGRKGHFITLLGMNLVWSFLLLKRTYGGLSRYGVRFVIGKLEPAWGAPAPSLDKALLGNIALDLFVFLILVPITRDFVSGVATLRLRYGFPQQEIIFRKPSQSTIANIVSEAPEKRDACLQDVLRRATDPEEMKQVAFGMPWEEWAYDYKAMAAAREANEKGTISTQTWELCVWMKMKDGWTAIEHGKEMDPQSQVGMMEKLRDRLQAMGKSHVFNQMMEVIQVKTMTKDGAPLPVTDDVDAIIVDIFKRNNVDFEKLTSELAKGASTSSRFTISSKKND
ncbi:hypothetical protein HYDPIDRAFT_176867 [Hydnomerulius pinastri MD-312]|uniref:PcRGLX/YetA-like N-terminal RIFT barrel domain-containing protein n=1 Tax=Hydnomerulius pinastri MD-312 TaxID=994086 RepID=A0A0C9VUK7_9AGAM|nr:hypothetical protein HYDPIDRAFT_176867 [Hydnomerulius pinastri MD-312]